MLFSTYCGHNLNDCDCKNSSRICIALAIRILYDCMQLVGIIDLRDVVNVWPLLMNQCRSPK